MILAGAGNLRAACAGGATKMANASLSPMSRALAKQAAIKEESESPEALRNIAHAKGEAEAVPAMPASLAFGLKDKIEQCFLKALGVRCIMLSITGQVLHEKTQADFLS